MHLKVLVRMRKSVVRYQRGNVRELGRLRFQEFFACRNIEEQITNGNRGPRRYSRLFNFEQLASSNLNSTAGRVICLPGFKAEPRDRGDRGQCLSAKSQSIDVQQIVGIMNLRGGMALEGEHGVVMPHATAVVDDAYQFPAATFDFDTNAGCARIQRIFKKFFDDRSWTLDNLAGSNLVSDVVGEYANAAHRGQRTTESAAAVQKPFHHGDTESTEED